MSAIPEAGTARLLFFLEQRLAQLRWSRENLAAQGGPSPSTVYKSMLGGRQPTERTLARRRGLQRRGAPQPVRGHQLVVLLQRAARTSTICRVEDGMRPV